MTAVPAAAELVATLRRDIAGLGIGSPATPTSRRWKQDGCLGRTCGSSPASGTGSSGATSAASPCSFTATAARASGVFFAASLATETAASEKLTAFARALGLTRPEDLVAVDPLPGALAYTHFVAWLALYGSDAEFAAAFLVNLPAWGRNCGRLAHALRARYGLGDAAVAFFDLFAGDAPDFEAAATLVIQGGLDRGVSPAAIRDAARLLQGYELMYWDALQAAAGAEGQPLRVHLSSSGDVSRAGLARQVAGRVDQRRRARTPAGSCPSAAWPRGRTPRRAGRRRCASASSRSNSSPGLVAAAHAARRLSASQNVQAGTRPRPAAGRPPSGVGR